MYNLPYGWRGKIGLIYIASAWSMEPEFYEMAPKGVTTHTTRIALSENPDCFSLEDLRSLESDIIEATKLLAQAPLSSIAFGCTSGSFSKGVGYDRQLIKEMEKVSKGIPCTTTATAVIEALKALNVKKVAVATPYEEAVYTLAKEFLEDHHITVTNVTGLGITSDYEISRQSIETIYNMAMESDTEDAEALFISCTGLSAVHLIETLEEDLGKPVISSNQATFWHSLRISGIHSKVEGFGKLFEL